MRMGRMIRVVLRPRGLRRLDECMFEYHGYRGPRMLADTCIDGNAEVVVRQVRMHHGSSLLSSSTCTIIPVPIFETIAIP